MTPSSGKNPETYVPSIKSEAEKLNKRCRYWPSEIRIVLETGMPSCRFRGDAAISDYAREDS